MNILIVYGTFEGQTAKIAQFMADIIRKKGFRVAVHAGDELPDNFTLDGFNAVILGGSIHIGKYPACLTKFINANKAWLHDIPSAFFTVCMAINSQNEKEKLEAKAFGNHFVERHDWHPMLIETFAGAVKYTQYKLITRMIMKWISRREGANTDTSCDHEYTDWNSVTKFAEQFVAKINELEQV